MNLRQQAQHLVARCRACILSVVVAVSLISLPTHLSAQENVQNREPALKGVMVYRFLEYIQWPDVVFANNQAPIVIGIYGGDPVGKILRQIATNQKVGERALEFKVVANAREAATCHVLFVGDDIPQQQGQALLTALDGLPILLVGEQDYFTGAGGVFSFKIVNNNLRFKLSTGAATNHQLKISAQLAKLAEVVP